MIGCSWLVMCVHRNCKMDFFSTYHHHIQSSSSSSRRFQLGHQLTSTVTEHESVTEVAFCPCWGTLEIESIDNIHDVRFDRVLTEERRIPHGMNTHQDEDHTLIRRCKCVLMIHTHKCNQTAGISHGKSEPSVDHGGVVFYRSSRHHLLSFQDQTYVFETSRKTCQDRVEAWTITVPDGTESMRMHKI